ncbi:ATP-grasp domain-containing protein [Bacillus sp. FJAT-27445]|uniref:ATP-grasp domain-containing protein n=1 Tax=Bacillus sp. FJAT-27445 TaxID=1679166 RepID=UPI00074349DC|nr:ATP-grasp domain-containing protein [Bacillus sp. FJAT-27445]
MASIVFIETYRNGSCMEGILAAKKLGYDIHLITAKKRYLGSGFPEVNQVHFVSILGEKTINEKLNEIKKEMNIASIISFIDPFVSLAAKLNRIHCGTNLSVDALRIMEDKIISRDFLRHLPYTPSYQIHNHAIPLKNLLAQLNGNYPVVLKKPSSQGSRDVYLIRSETQLKNRLLFLKSKNPKGDWLIEEYLDGPQYIVETIVHNREIHIAAIIEQEITKQLKFIVTGYSLSPVMDRTIIEGISEATDTILKELDLENGNCHLEIRCVNGKWKLIELNPRISGGAINTLIKHAYGFNYAEQILNLYMGKKPVLERKHEQSVFAHFFTVNCVGRLLNITGLQEARKSREIVDMYIKPKKGQILSPPLSMGHRYGYVIAKGATKEDARLNALLASSKVVFELAPLEREAR